MCAIRLLEKLLLVMGGTLRYSQYILSPSSTFLGYIYRSPKFEVYEMSW